MKKSKSLEKVGLDRKLIDIMMVLVEEIQFLLNWLTIAFNQ